MQKASTQKSVNSKYDDVKGTYGRKKENEKISSMFFTKFLDSHVARDMYKIFKDFEEIYEVVVPPKRYRIGKCYKFERLLNVKDDRFLAIKLENIFINR